MWCVPAGLPESEGCRKWAQPWGSTGRAFLQAESLCGQHSSLVLQRHVAR